MKIGNLFKRNSLDSATNQTRIQQQNNESRQRQNTNQISDDKVSISPLARQFAMVSQILVEDKELEQTKLNELKSQIESGQYSVSAVDLTQSIVSFARDNES